MHLHNTHSYLTPHKALQMAVNCIRPLMALDEPQQTAAVTSSTYEGENLKEQIARLTEQVPTLVASLSHRNTEGQQLGCLRFVVFVATV